MATEEPPENPVATDPDPPMVLPLGIPYESCPPPLDDAPENPVATDDPPENPVETDPPRVLPLGVPYESWFPDEIEFDGKAKEFALEEPEEEKELEDP